MTDRELILYACPGGPLGDTLAHYFADVDDRLGRTPAQTYPVHCTLTGFFRRHGSRADAVLDHLAAVVAARGPVPSGAVAVDRLGVRDGWVGLELTSAWLLDLTAAVVAADEPRPGEDALRPKDWLHVSLAYGVTDLEHYVAHALDRVDPNLPASWRVGFWERLEDGAWVEH